MALRYGQFGGFAQPGAFGGGGPISQPPLPGNGGGRYIGPPVVGGGGGPISQPPIPGSLGPPSRFLGGFAQPGAFGGPSPISQPPIPGGMRVQGFAQPNFGRSRYLGGFNQPPLGY